MVQILCCAVAAPVLTLIKGEQGVESFITFTKRGGGGGQETLRMHHFAEGMTWLILTKFNLLLP
jgi:hypothetical protein